MIRTTFEERRRLEKLDRTELLAMQLRRLSGLLEQVLPHNHFYAAKLAGLQLPITSRDQLRALPFTFKDELVGTHAEGDFAANLSYPLERYTHFHRTSGTRGRPLVVLDTSEDWDWWIENWQFVYDAAGVTARDRVFMAFSFGPFIGFWSAYDAAVARGALVIPGGGMGTVARLELLRASRATALCCTPSYALHLAEVAAEQQIDLRANDVRRIIVAGEPGGSVPAIRARIETAWNARVIDHSGATEVGAWGYSDSCQRGLHVIENEFLAEFLAPDTGLEAAEGEVAEIVITTLGRTGCPVIRYRTGDLVRPTWNRDPENNFVLLEGGVIGRTDDMLIIRGVNVFPSSLEQILHGFPEVVEYRISADRIGEMDALTIEVEDRMERPERVALEIMIRLGLKVAVRNVPIGSLPRFEGKGKRFVDNRPACGAWPAGSKKSP
jgi:phenylacetate-CoA ligase